jgi:hypothetical protein
MTGGAGDGATRPRGAWRGVMWGGAALLLLAPWLAMRFTTEVTWDGADFLAFGLMLMLACIAGEVVARTVRTRAGRMLAVGGIVLAFVLLWAELALGVIDRW